MSEKSSRILVPENIRNLKPYKAGKTIEEVKSEYHPRRISKLASNENRLGCSPVVEVAVREALEEIQDYPDSNSRRLRAEIAQRNDVKPEQVIVAGGSESIIAILCRTFFPDREEILTADATFVGIFVHAGIQGVPVRKVPVTDAFGFDLDGMAAAVTDRTKLIYIANPNNPTGTYATRSEFETFMDRVPDDVLVVMDEAYYEYAEGVGDYPHALDYDYDNLLVLRTFSKAYGLAGFRVGYGIGDEKLISNMMKTKLTFEPTTLGQAAALAALRDDDFLERSRQMVRKGKRRLYRFLDTHDVDYVPSISNAVLMVFPGEQEAVDFNQAMLEQGVILRRVEAFGLPNGIRITIGTDEEMNHFERSFARIVVS